MPAEAAARGPLAGLRVLEFAGVGPGPFCAMLLSDMGADIVRIDRPGGSLAPPIDIPSRGRTSIEIDMKTPAGIALCLDAIGQADVLIEGFRPGVMEKLGLGPTEAHARNPRLIYGRMTGWGQEGPLAGKAGHDINYIAVTGALAAMGPPDRPPPPPLNLVGDFGGGALYLAFGIAAALVERERSGLGQVVDAAMIDGVTSLMAIFFGLDQAWPGALARGTNGLGGAAPNYRCYECADGRHVAVGALEPQFYAQLLAGLGAPYPPPVHALKDRDPSLWPDQCATLAALFRTRSRDEWVALFADADACLSPVLTLEEARDHPQLAQRGTHVTVAGLVQPAPAPRLSRTPGHVQGPAPRVGEGGADRLRAWGVAVSGA